MSVNRGTSKHTREAVADVKTGFPAGCHIRHIQTGLTFTMGVQHGVSKFWMMQHNPQRKGLVEAQLIKLQYERIKEGE